MNFNFKNEYISMIPFKDKIIKYTPYKYPF